MEFPQTVNANVNVRNVDPLTSSQALSQLADTDTSVNDVSLQSTPDVSILKPGFHSNARIARNASACVA